MAGLATLEEHLISLWSPRWQDTDLPFDEKLAAKGKGDYDTYCRALPPAHPA